MELKDFLIKKSQLYGDFGFDPIWIPDALFPFQKYLVEWAIKKGRAAIFSDTGTGKTFQELVWAENVVRKTNGNVIIFTPLAVSGQTIQEAEKFGIEAQKSDDGKPSRITVTNYEKIHLFNPDDFTGIVCDESGILKNFAGRRKQQIIIFARKMKYRLLCTATPSPNDYIELGNSAEALGYMGYMDMLNRFFKNTQNNSNTKRHYGKGAKWRFKGHAEKPFWRWVSSWARAMRLPSDLGFENDGYILPGLEERQYVVKCSRPLNGMLFQIPARGRKEELQERRLTLTERCEKVAELVDHDKPALVWCHNNDEGDLLEKIIPDGLQVAGRHDDKLKEERLLGFPKGDFRVLITKPKIGAWGLNYQHCSHTTFFPSHSFEQYYQGLRRCYRFGQKNKVTVDIVSTEGEINILKNFQRKQVQADRMFEHLINFMNQSIEINTLREFNNEEILPTWL